MEAKCCCATASLAFDFQVSDAEVFHLRILLRRSQLSVEIAGRPSARRPVTHVSKDRRAIDMAAHATHNVRRRTGEEERISFVLLC